MAVFDDATTHLTICTFVLALKLFVTQAVQGGKKVKVGRRAPEDAKLFNLAQGWNNAPPSGEESDPDWMAALRWDRVIMNDLENIPIGLLVAFTASSTANNMVAHIIFVYMFTVMRILHTICFAYVLQPGRTLSYVFAWVAVFGMGINGVVGAIKMMT